MAVHPLRPATHHCLGEPLPLQLANGTQSSLTAHIAFIILGCPIIIILGISIRFQMLSLAVRQVLYALLTRPPPKSKLKNPNSSRLACVKHSVSVHPEPGSNSSFNLFNSSSLLSYLTPNFMVAFLSFLYSVANVLVTLTSIILTLFLVFVNNIFLFFFNFFIIFSYHLFLLLFSTKKPL